MKEFFLIAGQLYAVILNVWMNLIETKQKTCMYVSVLSPIFLRARTCIRFSGIWLRVCNLLDRIKGSITCKIWAHEQAPQ
jgi:hypothetical protein